MTELAQPSAASRPVRRIQPSRGFFQLDLAELWRYRELLYFLVWRDVKARYKQTFLGPFWAVFRPFVSMVIFTVIFGHLARIKAGNGIPYPLFVFTGLLAWTYFSSTLTGGASSVVGSANLVTKAYFPRLYVPLAAVAAPLVDFALSFVVLVGMFAWYQRFPSWHIVFLPFFVALALLAGLGISLWLAPITVRFRDVPFALPFIVQLWMYATPVIYPVTLVPPHWRWLISVNPLTAVVEGFRFSLLGPGSPGATALGSSIGISVALVATGLVYFRRMERRFADLI